MLCSLSKLKASNVCAVDGPIGKIKDFYFDEKNWIIRYMLIDSDGYLNRSNGFISTSSISNIDMGANRIQVNFSSNSIGKKHRSKKEVDQLTGQQKEKQHEIQFSDFFKRPSSWGLMDYPWVVGPQGVIYENIQGKNEIRLQSSQPNLPSYNQISKYQVHAVNAYLGHIKDILINDETWQFQFLEVAKGAWITSQSTLIPYDLIEQLNPEGMNIDVLTDRMMVSTAPIYDADNAPIFYFENILEHYKAYTQIKPAEIKRLELSNQ
ncbi:MAG: hypothetical protein A2X86_14370 [Bdellovibrionales bacterium GWA2_49_15]|nr:MAG: hypothetical protein A2X86_14370 [Bdellovibrionales bacterium GWA2_49_15]HAZ13847.1 hypothetical protein [Bdellovibrionales bacterium]